MIDSTNAPRAIRSSAWARGAGFLGFWLALIGIDPVDLVVGVMAAAIATWVSLRLLPPGPSRFRLGEVASYVLRFLHQSVVAGVDVARRALDPRLPLRPGFVVHQCNLPHGAAHDAFCAITGLLPGTLPCGPDKNGGIVIHCLDTREPVIDQLTEEEVQFVRALGGERHDG